MRLSGNVPENPVLPNYPARLPLDRRVIERSLQLVNLVEQLDELAAECSHPVFHPWWHFGEASFIQNTETYQLSEPFIQHFAAETINRMFHFTGAAHALSHQAQNG